MRGQAIQYAGQWAFAFRPEDASWALGIPERQVPAALELLRQNGDLGLSPSEQNGNRYAAKVIIDGHQERRIVILHRADRLGAERLLRARLYDEAVRRRAAFEALA